MAGEYFELGTLPAYGMYARNVRWLSMSIVRFEVESADLRSAGVFDRAEYASINWFSAQEKRRGGIALRFIDTRDVLLSACRIYFCGHVPADR